MSTGAAYSPPSGGVVAREPVERELGWHADPWRRHQQRFHDGAQWTEHVADDGRAGLDTEPVADQPWSQPEPAHIAPPIDLDGDGPRVIAATAEEARAALAGPLLLFDDRPAHERAAATDAVSSDSARARTATKAGVAVRRDLLAPDDTLVGTVRVVPASRARRIVHRLVSDPTEAITRLEVEGSDGSRYLRLDRPLRRSAPVVDVAGAEGDLGIVEAQTVVQGLRATVRNAAGDDVATLVQEGRGAATRKVTASDGTLLARLTAVWDVPGARYHLPPGVLLLDRRGAPLDDAGLTALVLGALLAPELLLL